MNNLDKFIAEARKEVMVHFIGQDGGQYSMHNTTLQKALDMLEVLEEAITYMSHPPDTVYANICQEALSRVEEIAGEK